MHNPIVLQLIGQARSGKDYTATQLKNYYESIGKSVQIYSYAAPLKQITAALFNLTLEQLDDYKNRADEVYLTTTDCASMGHFIRDISFRTILQRMGNEAIKPTFGAAVWANLAQQAINQSEASIIILSDCRFLVELETIGGLSIRVLNTALPARMQHPSELELAHVVTHYTLDNTNYRADSTTIAILAEQILHNSTQI